jgi:F-type H+-transporting ATPase subunit b
MEALGLNPNLLITQILNFAILLILLRLLLYKPILDMLNTRKAKIQESLEFAEKVTQQAAAQQKDFEKKLEETRREMQAAAATATQAGEKERERIIAEARVQAQREIEKGREQVEYERKQMLAELRDQVVQLSLLAAQKLVSQSFDDKTHRQLINDFLVQTDKLENKN